VRPLRAGGLGRRFLLGAACSAVAGLTTFLGAPLPPSGAAAPQPSGRLAAGTTYACSGSEVELFDNTNGYAVSNNGTSPTFSTDGEAYCLVEIYTYHWNGGDGATPGELGLQGEDEEEVGPFDAVGSSGEDGAPDVNWTANVPTSPPVVIDGEYEEEDSDPGTWSQDDESDGYGFAEVWGEEATEVTTTTSGTTTTSTTAPTEETTTSSSTTSTLPTEETSTTEAEPTTSPPTERPCKCEGMRVDQQITDVETSHSYQVGDRTYPLAVAVTLDVVLDCTGGTGRCSGVLDVEAPAGWYLLSSSPGTSGGSFPGTAAQDFLEIQCTGACGGEEAQPVTFWAVASSADRGPFVWTFLSICDGATLAQFWVQTYRADGSLAGGPDGQHLETATVNLEAPEEEPEAPCQCDRLTLGEPSISLAAYPKNGHPFTKLTLLVPNYIVCTGGAGHCYGQVTAVLPPGWYGGGWYSAVPSSRDSTNLKVGAPVGGIGPNGDIAGDTLDLTCAGTCGANTTIGADYLVAYTDQFVASTTLTFAFRLACPEGTVKTQLINIPITRGGGINTKGVTVTPTTPPPPPPPNNCECTSIELGANGGPHEATFFSDGTRAVINVPISYELQCFEPARSIDPCSTQVTLGTAPPGMQGFLYSGTYAKGKAANSLTVTCTGFCEHHRRGEKGTTGTSFGQFMLSISTSGPVHHGQQISFTFTAACQQGQVTKSVLTVTVLDPPDVVWDMVPAA